MAQKSIYQLRDPESAEVRYIGASSDPAARLLSHRANKASPVRGWLQQLEQKGANPVLELLHEPSESWQELERKAIAEAVAVGAPLLNTKDAGRNARDARAHLTRIELGRRLRKLREERNWGQAQVAAMVGCSSSLVAGWENGTREPGAGDIDTLSRLFDIAAEELLSPLTEQRVVLLRMTKEQYAEIQAHAKALGVTVKSYVLSNVAPGTTPGVAAPNALAQAPQRLQRLETALGAFFDSASDASDVGLHKAIAEGQAALRAKEE